MAPLWERVVTCQQLVAELRKAGLGVTAPYVWLGQTSSTGESSFKPGSPKPTKAHPCTGAIPRLHSHFFTASGQFGSLDWKGGQVDDGSYHIVNSNTFHIGSPGVTFHFRILHGQHAHVVPGAYQGHGPSGSGASEKVQFGDLGRVGRLRGAHLEARTLQGLVLTPAAECAQGGRLSLLRR
jgi:hypothetical protein